MTTLELLRCNTCGEDKPTTEFHRNRSCVRGYQYRCKPCHTIKTRQYRNRLEPAATLPELIDDLLGIDQGWWTVPNLADRLGYREGHVSRVLFRMRADGRVRSRVRVKPAGPDENEWAYVEGQR